MAKGARLVRLITKDQRLTRRILKTILQLWITNRHVDAWAKKINIFFVLAIGRSGTSFLAQLLNQAEGAHVVHEPVGEDFLAYRRAFHNPGSAYRYVNYFRKREIYLRARSRNPDTYGEVNSLLRRHAAALTRAFPGANFLHLVRDGRDVVRSMDARLAITPDDKHTQGIRAHPDDPFALEWDQMDRFERLCWYWQAENSYLRQNIDRSVKFEHILASYDYFCEHILEPLHLRLPHNVWSKAVNLPRNITKDHTMPPWEDWSHKQQKAFRRICGDEMVKYSYAF